MESTKKRPNPSTTRLPLKETSGNIPSPAHKKTKLNATNAPKVTNILQNKPNLANRPQLDKSAAKPAVHTRLVGEELQQWRSSWRKIMKNSVIYFDTQGTDPNNMAHLLEQKKAQKAFKYIGSMIVPFFDKEVSIIISRRQYSASTKYNSNDIFHDAANLKIKVWNFDKVFRFLKNLGITDLDNLTNNSQFNSAANYSNGDLLNLLKEEKIFGSTDKDPNARRDDLHYFENKYLYVYDLAQKVRPIAAREWLDESYPTFHLTMDGKCPFIPDTENTERRKNRRLKKFDETESYRKLLNKTAYNLIDNIKNKKSVTTSTNPSTDDVDDSTISQRVETDEKEVTIDDQEVSEQDGSPSDNEDDEILMERLDFKYPKPTLARESSCIPTNNSNSRFFEVAASGFNGTSNAVQVSIDSGNFPGNGLGPTISQVPSKNLNNLKRRIFMKRQKQKTIGDREKDKDSRPGYCENCRIKYDHFEDHIVSSRHRKFACDDSNFKDIDKLIQTLNESKSFGYITSDGDFSYC